MLMVLLPGLCSHSIPHLPSQVIHLDPLPVTLTCLGLIYVPHLGESEYCNTSQRQNVLSPLLIASRIKPIGPQGGVILPRCLVQLLVIRKSLGQKLRRYESVWIQVNPE